MDSSMHRARARGALKGNWGIAILVSLVAGLLGGGVTSGGLSFKININLDEAAGPVVTGDLPAGMENLLVGILGVSATVMLVICGIMSIVNLVLGGAMCLGYARYNLNLIDQKEATFNDLFSQFDRFGPALAMSLLRNLYVFLWSLLLVIPGLVASYGYAMAPYIMLEDPDCSASEALARSKAMMDGHKGELFCLELSFIGWGMLVVLTGNIGNLFLNPYQAAAWASFYRDLQTRERYIEE